MLVLLQYLVRQAKALFEGQQYEFTSSTCFEKLCHRRFVVVACQRRWRRFGFLKSFSLRQDSKAETTFVLL